MSSPRILVVDDHREIRDAVVAYLGRNGLHATAVRGAAEMDAALAERRFDLVVLDVMMPGEDGLSATRRLAAAGGPPVLLLTALGEETDRIVGLEIGADDYLPKPFNPRELLARVRAILRRTERPEMIAGAATGARLAFAGWVLDTDARRLTPEAGGDEVPLTTAEFKLLTTLLDRPRAVFSRERLLDAVHGRSAHAFDRAIDNLVSRLRRKIETDPAAPILSTVRAGGYSLTAEVRRL